MREPRTTSVLDSPRATVLVAVALLFVALAQVIRVLFPRILILGEDTSYLLAGVLAFGVFAAPLVALPLARRGVAGRAMVAGGLAILAARVLLQFIHPIPTWLAFAGPGTALTGMALLLVGLRARYAIDSWLAPVSVLGLAFDTASGLCGTRGTSRGRTGPQRSFGPPPCSWRHSPPYGSERVALGGRSPPTGVAAGSCRPSDRI